MSIILGIDPGSRLCGYGVIEARGQRLCYVDCGVIDVAKLDFPRRLRRIHDALYELVARHGADAVALEEVFMGRNASSALKLGQARGAALVACTRHDLEVAEYSPSKVKQAVTGSGRAEKKQIQHMITAILGLDAVPPEDAADALAVAVCHAHTRASLIRMAGARRSRGRRLVEN